MANNTSPSAIRLSVTSEVRKALSIAKKRYPTLSDTEILKLGLSKIVTEDTAFRQEGDEIRISATSAVGYDYLSDSDEDLYTVNSGKEVHFS